MGKTSASDYCLRRSALLSSTADAFPSQEIPKCARTFYLPSGIRATLLSLTAFQRCDSDPLVLNDRVAENPGANQKRIRNLEVSFCELKLGGVRSLPSAFTEQCVAMLSSVLRGKRAVQVNIAVMRAFVQLRRALGSHAELGRPLILEEQFLSNFNTRSRKWLGVNRTRFPL